MQEAGFAVRLGLAAQVPHVDAEHVGERNRERIAPGGAQADRLLAETFELAEELLGQVDNELRSQAALAPQLKCNSGGPPTPTAGGSG